MRRFDPKEFQNDSLYDSPNAEDEGKATAAAAKKNHDRLVAAKAGSGSDHTNEVVAALSRKRSREANPTSFRSVQRAQIFAANRNEPRFQISTKISKN
ncbi:hypothetical protein PHMEG_00015911 [Phytophthora megakarya]|uniref:Uncharacterized protein n=1 Tax=Phytophthora megakarya TaxID=4795 RepID=A0A225W2N3_9STRA|nr:hypothetical protein PHMEG_00015911 [Phytophthora megakarya]